MMRLQRRKGFSLTEIVISMSLVVMISAIGFFSCVVAIKISSRSEAEAKIYSDVEKFGLSLSSAYNDVGGNEYIDKFIQNLEWYFEADGLASRVKEQNPENEWTVEMPVKFGNAIIDEEGNREIVRSISVHYEGTSYLISVKDSAHYTECNIYTDYSGARIKGYRNNSSNAVYEKEIAFAKTQKGDV